MKITKKTLFPLLILSAALAVGILGTRPKGPPAAQPQTHAHQEHSAAGGAMCGEHNVIEEECGICRPELAASLAPGQGLKIRFVSNESASRAGIETAAPTIESATTGVECYAEIAFDQNRTAYVVSPVEGVLDEVLVDLGHRVRAGDALVTLSSAAVADAQSEYLRAFSEWRLRDQAFERERALFADRISPERDMQEASAARDAAGAAVQQARKRLRVLGFDDAQIDGLASSTGDAAGAFEMKAPFAGEIIERAAVRGSRIEAGTTLFVIADRSVMWGMLNIPERDVSRVRVGQAVELTADASMGDPLKGKITWVSPQVDARTRMAQARAEIRAGYDGLPSGSFARAWIETGDPGRAVVVPEAAIQRVESKPFVFIRLEDDLYEVRAVVLGASRNGRVEVTEGLGTNVQVAVAHSYIVKSEFLKSRLGAGCVDD